MLDPIGVIHGRFQMLHHGHMEYLLAGKKRCQRLIIGISNPDEGCTFILRSISLQFLLRLDCELQSLLRD